MLERLFLRHLEDDEPLHIVVHRHWALGLRGMMWPIAFLFATWVLLAVAPVAVVALLVFCLDVALLVWLLRNFLDYYLDAWLVTDRSVIDVEWHGWFHRRSTRIDYSSIEGVSCETQGLCGTILRYGKVTIEKIGTGATVSIEDVASPRSVESVILACQEACIRAKNLKDSSAVQDMIAEIVAERMYLKEHKP